MSRSAREGVPDDAINIHASTVTVEGKAVLITGEAGSGKSHLALALVEQWQAEGRDARLVSDDQVFLVSRSGRLIAIAPHAIAGLAEVRGVGIVKLPHGPRAIVVLVADLGGGAVPADAGVNVSIEGVELPLLRVAPRSTQQSKFAVAAAIASIRTPDGQENAAFMLASDNDLGLLTGRGRTT